MVFILSEQCVTQFRKAARLHQYTCLFSLEVSYSQGKICPIVTVWGATTVPGTFNYRVQADTMGV